MVTQNIQVNELWAMIVTEIGDTTPPTLMAWAPMMWQRFADKALIAPRLQEWYFYRTLCGIKLGNLANQVDFSMSGDISLRLDQRRQYLLDQKKMAQAEIDKLETWAQAVRPPVNEPIAAYEIEQPPGYNGVPPYPQPHSHDANSPIYHGDPYFPAVNTEERTW